MKCSRTSWVRLVSVSPSSPFESVKVSPELAEDGLERFRDALIKGGYESWMQLLHDLGYKDKKRMWRYQYVLETRVTADGSLIGD